MKKISALLFFIFLSITVYGNTLDDVISTDRLADTALINKLNSDGYNLRRSDADQTIKKATKALKLSIQLNFLKGIGESYRVIGVGYDYHGEPEKAIDNYLNALSYFQRDNNLSGQAKVYNNIGNLYRDSDFGESLEYFRKSLKIALKINDENLIASLYLNIGNVYYRQKDFYEALKYYNKSNDLFSKLNNTEYVVTCMQNLGVVYFNLKRFDQAEKLLLASNQQAKASSRYQQIASIDLTLTSLYIGKGDFKKAEQYLDEGIMYAEMIKSKRLLSDFKYTSYQLEVKRKNFEKALYYLQDIYKKDSLDFQNYVSARIGLLLVKHKQEEKARETQLALIKQKNERVIFWGVVCVAALLLVVIVLLVGNVRRKAETNKRLTDLNGEVSRQKDNLDRVNHHLEEIIDERTKDLQIKNRKLAEYSSYLSHQIRGPIATLKGLINLEKEGLVNKAECFNMMDKCVSEIDNKIMDMSDMLHDPERTGM
ncbi:tetratricopeptide repeat protein [Mucilaginibacter sp. RS28]|uniref:Tetratricopeptide repeat protein n=1 Tax=Mucilaginibacter straminoryzae TaxID=2932774 RepID=A0A9X2BAM2_9SPHI|nr:tetratricopeptide repeat protein [Mucilaginibacter straminoryzae]MCJ8210930.1 tetratricopeptide repeat protein [Mucilaginibacter straminoryzae]